MPQCLTRRCRHTYIFRCNREVVSHVRLSTRVGEAGIGCRSDTADSSPICRQATANVAEAQVCDVSADYSLGVEDYADAIRVHREILRKNPDNALAHYHLGFAEGMIGNRATEIDEYRRAEVLGLRTWDLFLNHGLAELEGGDIDAATNSLRIAVVLGEEHPEAHFNLALAEERRGMLVDAERETKASLSVESRTSGRAQPARCDLRTGGKDRPRLADLA